MFRVMLSPVGQSIMLGASLAFALAIVGLGAVRYRGTHNPSALFLTWGFAVLAANILLVIAWSGLHPVMRGTSGLRMFARELSVRSVRTEREVLGWWMAGWIGAGAGLLILRPWWDRRGRRPVNPRRVALAAIGITAVLDVFVALAASATTWIFAVAAIGLLIAAGARSIGRTWVRILPLAAAALAAVGIGLQLENVTLATALFRWSDLAFPLALACVFGALLVDERADHTRMRRATDRARAVMGGRAEIASMLGHEVKGPVATIRGLAATSLAHYDRLSAEEQREFLSLIEQESRKLLTTVDQASLAMKVDARAVSFVMHPTDLAVVVRDVLDRFEPGSHRLTFTSVDPPATAIVDRKWLAEALRQLLLNAANYSPANSPITVAVRLVDRNTVAMDVSDEGPGIPDDKRETVFEKFAAWRPAGYEEVAGTGLGLFIARGIVRAHRGDIRFSDRPREGTMLSIQLPAERPTEAMRE